MALSFTGSLSVATAGAEDVRIMLVGALLALCVRHDPTLEKE